MFIDQKQDQSGRTDVGDLFSSVKSRRRRRERPDPASTLSRPGQCGKRVTVANLMNCGGSGLTIQALLSDERAHSASFTTAEKAQLTGGFHRSRCSHIHTSVGPSRRVSAAFHPQFKTWIFHAVIIVLTYERFVLQMYV